MGRLSTAVEKGYIAEEIAPLKVTRNVIKKGEDPRQEEFTAAEDECNRPTTTLDGLSSLNPVFKTQEEGGTVTAGNASQLSDGASSTLLMASSFSSLPAQAASTRTAAMAAMARIFWRGLVGLVWLDFTVFIVWFSFAVGEYTVDLAIR